MIVVVLNSQTCIVEIQFNTCSSNSACGCLPLSNSNTLGICGLRNASCSEFAPCQSPNDSCAQPEHVCIRPPRCGSPLICYPLWMADQTLCPPSQGKTTEFCFNFNRKTTTRIFVSILFGYCRNDEHDISIYDNLKSYR